MKKTKVIALIGASLTVLSLTGTAQAERSFGDIYKQCGIGAMIFDKKGTFAAISNIVWDLGTTAISSNASSKENCNNNKVAAAAFIHHTYASLEQDIAKGEGKHVSALMDIMGCSAASRSTVVNAIRTDFSSKATVKGFSDLPQVNKSETIYNIIDSSTVKASCGA